MAVSVGVAVKFCVKTVLVLILAFLTWIPVYIARFVVSILGPIIQPRLHSIVEVNNAMFANIAHDSANMAILLTTTLQPGPSINLTELRRKFEALLKLKDDVRGEMIYAKLKQSVERWGGFPFWVNDSDFRVDNHIFQINLRDGQGLVDYKKKLLSQKFEAGKSPWEVHLLKGIIATDSKGREEVRDAILFKFHHCLLDGHGLTTVLVEQVCDQNTNLGRNPKSGLNTHKSKSSTADLASFLKNIALSFAFHLGALLDFIKVVDWIPEENGLHSLPGKDMSGNVDPHLVQLTHLRVDDIKKARKRNDNVHYFVVVLEAITCAMRETFLRIGAPLPATISCYSPLPHPSHPRTLGNYWWGLTIPLPVGVAEKGKRLEILSKFLAKEGNGWRAGCAVKLWEMLGGLSRWQLSQLTDVNHFTVSISDFAGPKKELEAFGGKKLLGIDYVVGFPKGRMGIVWHGLSYNGAWHLNLMVDRAILGNQTDVEAIVRDCAKQITENC